jgi:hypothetical protein
MTCPHSLNGSPDMCSQCQTAPVRKVSIVDGQTTVDGVAVPERRPQFWYPPKRKK